jgi:signal peptidase I
MASDPTPNIPELGDVTRKEASLRGKAKLRLWVCPGAGFALIGYPVGALVTFLTALSVLPLVVWFSYQPGAASGWALIVVGAFSLCLNLAEYRAVRRLPLRDPAPRFLAGGFALAASLVWLLAAAAVVVFVTSFGSLVMAGSGMAPTLARGERLVYHKHIDWGRVKPGAVIVYKNAEDSAWGQPGWLITARILAGPGDRLSIRSGRYLVNGKLGPPFGSSGEFTPVLDVPDAPNSVTVPDDCFFVVQDDSANSFDSQVLSWARKPSIVGSRLCGI